MELLHGLSLHGLITQRGRLTVATTCELARQTCDALVAAHELGIIDRDVKPHNLIVTTAQLRAIRRCTQRHLVDGGEAHQLLTGRLPFVGESAADLVVRQYQERPPRIDVVEPSVPKALADIVERCLAVDPKDRAQTAAELAVAHAPFGNVCVCMSRGKSFTSDKSCSDGKKCGFFQGSPNTCILTRV